MKKKGIQKMKSWYKIMIIAVLSFLMAGCDNKKDVMKDEIIHYVEQTNEIAEIKNQAITTYNDICSDAKGMEKDELLGYLQTEVLNKLEEYETKLAQITVNTKELEDFKLQLQEIVAKQKQDVQDTVDALKGCNPDVVDEINLSIEENKSAYEEYMSQLQEYAKKYQIQITEE